MNELKHKSLESKLKHDEIEKIDSNSTSSSSSCIINELSAPIVSNNSNEILYTTILQVFNLFLLFFTSIN